MNNTDNLLTGYCFLASLTENQNDLFNHVYVPICKRALSLYSLKGASHGNASNIKEIIQNEYAIDIPIIMVRKLINSAYKSLSNRAKKKYNFKVFGNGEQFEIQKYTFSDLEIQYKKSQRNVKALEEAFLSYLKIENIDTSSVPTFSDFLDKNKKHLASFFKNSTPIKSSDVDISFIYHIHFLEHIDTSNNNLFEIAKGLYLGSIVASFLEAGLDLEPKFKANETYYLDTPIILKALNLQKEEETEPILELLELIRNTGGKIKVLSITISEISKVIEHAINTYNTNIPTSTINEACLRLEKNKAWLIRFNGNIEKNILETLKIEKEDIDNVFLEKNQKNPDVKALQERRIRKGNALHDVIAYLYVRKIRGTSVLLFQKVNAWFLSCNTELLKFNHETNPNNGIPEIVLPDALTGILWLKNPQKLIDKVKKIGLSELMATTLNEEVASKEIINEFEANIKSIDGISDEDYRILLESVAYQSAKKIENFNEIAFNNKDEAKIEAHKIVEFERSRKAKRIKEIKDAQAETIKEEEKNKNLQEQLSRIEHELVNTKNLSDNSKTQIESLSYQLETQKKIFKRIIIWLIITLILAILIIVIYYFKDIFDFMPKVFNWILSAGGLFGFGNLIINIIKFFKGK